MLSRITPLILTYNEEPNIGRVLDRLAWASRIVVIDSFSTDGTLDIAASYGQVEVYQRAFDTFANQCNYGLQYIETEWVLSLDADYLCESELIDEIAALPAGTHMNGFAAPFKYCIFGKALRGALYPPRIILYRRNYAQYEQDGHAHRVKIDGPTGRLKNYVLHDDWKPLSSWLIAQDHYTKEEALKLSKAPLKTLDFTDRLRKKIIIVPLLTPVYCLFRKGLIFDGWQGCYYTMQRTYAELLLSLRLIDARLRPSSIDRSPVTNSNEQVPSQDYQKDVNRM